MSNNVHLERMAFLFPEVLKALMSEMNATECDLPIPHRRILHTLGCHGAKTMTMSDLSKAIGIETSTATTHIDAMVKSGLVERLRSENDRRIVLVQLTAAGVKMSEEMVEMLKRNIATIMNKLSPDNQLAVRTSFEKLHEILQEVQK